ncbi:MAG: hypothetical protein CMO81_01575 [Waddliaceae bacterium]|nr:hypothetical protein [Waddliaceae bacterium]
MTITDTILLITQNSNAYTALSTHLIPSELSIGALVRSSSTLGSATLGTAALVSIVAGPTIALCALKKAEKDPDKSTGIVYGLAVLGGLALTGAAVAMATGSYLGFRWTCAGASVAGQPTEILFNQMLLPFSAIGLSTMGAACRATYHIANGLFSKNTQKVNIQQNPLPA